MEIKHSFTYNASGTTNISNITEKNSHGLAYYTENLRFIQS